MKRVKKTLGIISSVGIATTLLLAGCGNSESTNATASSKSKPKVENITFSWWTNPTRTKMTHDAIKLFEKKYPNIHVTEEYMPWTGYWPKLATKAAGGSLPDVMQMDGSQLNQYISQNRLMDLSKAKIDTSNIGSTTLSLGKVNGKQYAIPTSVNAQILLYNPSVLEKAGVTVPTDNYTWDDFAKMLIQIHDKTGLYGIQDDMEQPAFLDYYARTKKENLYSKDGKSIGISKKTLTSYFEWWLNLQEKGGVPSAQFSASYDHNNTQDNPMIKGKAGFQWIFLGGDTAAQQLLNAPIGRTLLPEWGNANKPYPLHGAMFWSISSNTKYPDGAQKLVDFLENDPQVSKIFMNDRGIPANQKNRDEDTKSSTDENVKAQSDIMEKIQKIATPLKLDPPGASELTKLLLTISQQVQNKSITPSQAADQFLQQANQQLSSN